MQDVLIALHDPPTAQMITEACQRAGYTVVRASSTEAALERVHDAMFPLIVLAEYDADMQRQHAGASFFDLLRGHPDLYALSRRHRYVALCVSDLSVGDRALLDAMRARHLRLPVKEHELIEVVRDLTMYEEIPWTEEDERAADRAMEELNRRDKKRGKAATQAARDAEYQWLLEVERAQAVTPELRPLTEGGGEAEDLDGDRDAGDGSE